MENLEKDLKETTETTETKSVEEVIKTEIEDLKKSLRTELEKEFKTRYEQLPSLDTETIEVKKSRSEMNKEFKDFLLTKATMTTANSPAVLSTQLNEFIVGSTGGKKSIGLDYCFKQSLDSYKLVIPRTTSGGTTSNFAKEGHAGSGSNFNIVPVELPMQVLTTRIDVSAEMMRTSGYDLIGYFNQEVNKSINKKLDKVVLVGDGSDALPFTGIANDVSASLYTQSGSGAFNPTFQDLVNFESKLHEDFRDDAVLITTKEGLAVLKGMKDNSNRPIWIPAFSDKVETIMGYPVVLTSQLPTPAVSGSTKGHMILGDLKAYHVADNSNGAEIFIDPYSGASTRTTTYYYNWYMSAGSSNPDAYSVYKLQ